MMRGVSGAATTGRVSAAQRATIAACGIGTAAGWNLSNITAIATTIAHDYGIALATVGFFTTALFAAHAGVQVPGGALIDRLGAKRMGLLGLSIIAATNGIALIAPHTWLALLMRALMGLGTGISFVGGSDYIRKSGAGGIAQGVYGGIGLAGGGIAVKVVAATDDWLHWRAPFITSVIVAGAAVVLLALGPKEGVRKLPTRIATAVGDRAPVRLYRLMILHIATFGLSVLISNWLVELLRHHGYSKSTAAWVGLLVLAVGVISRPLGGWTATQPWTRRALGGSLLTGALGSLCLCLAGPLWLAIVGALLVGLAAGVPFATVFMSAARARPHAPARAVGLVNGSASIMILAGAPLVGLSISLPGEGRIGFAVIGVLWAAAVLVLPTRRELGLE